MDKKFNDITEHYFRFILEAVDPIERERRLEALRKAINEEVNKGGSSNSKITIIKHI